MARLPRRSGSSMCSSITRASPSSPSALPLRCCVPASTPQPRRGARSYSTTTTPGGALRSWLFVPGRQDMLQKVLQKKGQMVLPDVLLPDMEDSVPVTEKAAARETIAELLPQLAQLGPNTKILPRVNSLETGLIEQDLQAVIAKGDIIFGVSVGKVGTAEDMKRIDDLVSNLERKNGIPSGKLCIVPWLETAAGVVNAREICRSSNRIVGVAYGGDDFLTDMGVQGASDQGPTGLVTYARSAISVAARAANVLALETPYVNFRSVEGLRAQALEVKRLGYRGMFAIHPSQVQTINECFSPTSEEIEYARKVVAVYEEAERQGKGSTSVDGKMVDAPVVKRAYALLRSLPQS